MRPIQKAAVAAIAALGIGFGSFCAWARWNDEKWIIDPDRSAQSEPSGSLGLPTSRIAITTGDGVKLDAWEIPPENGDPGAFWILHLHGNSSNLGTPGYAVFYAQLRRMNIGVLALDYRGFGKSEGNPTEAGMYADGEAAFRFLRDVRHVPANRIVIYGFSLGSGVATELATRFDFAGLILDGAFTSIRDRTQEIYPYLPIVLLQNDRFASLGRMGAITVPKLFIHATGDSRIPISHGRALFAAAKSPKEFLEVPGEHDTAYKTDPAAFFGGIERFVTGLRARLAM